MITSVKAHAKVPVAVGFGIHTTEQATDIARLADGVIVGSAIVRIIEDHKAAAGPHLHRYVQAMKTAIH
jgi:tryptophan synthase alpha chain